MPTTTGGARACEDGLFIGGRWRWSAASVERRNPARPEQVVGWSSTASAADVADAYAAAADAAPAWARLPPTERGEVLVRAASLVERRLERFATTLMLEEGKPIGAARRAVRGAAAILRRHGTDAPQRVGELYPGRVPGALIQSLREPRGVVCALTPWNVSIAIPAGRLGAALALGNTVVWNPADVASGTAALLIAALTDARLPVGVVNLVTGGSAEIGNALLSGEALDGVLYSGPAAAGRGVAAFAAERRIAARVDFAGMNPSLVLADADLDGAAGRIVRSAMLATGQRCIATRRAIVVESAFDAMAERIIEAASALRTGDPADERTDVGPLASAERLQAATELLETAIGEGLEPACGGSASSPADGFFVQPTVYVDVDPGSRLAEEEIFAPLLTVTRAADEADAVRLANACEVGLTASIFTSDLASALRCAGDLEARDVHLNQAPGNVMGAWAREFFTDTKTIYIDGV
jgi:aldehyde dehydrogenase (NAD+)